MEIDSLAKDAPVYLESVPDFGGENSVKKILGVASRPVARITAVIK